MNAYTTTGAIVATACSSLALAGPVVNLAPGQYYEGLSGITNSAMPELIGTVEHAAYQQFSIDSGTEGANEPLYSGWLLSSVVRSNMTGNLMMNFRLYNPNASLGGQISHIDISGFAGLETRVEYRNEANSPGNAGPSTVERSIDGDMLTFDFGTSFQTGDSSKHFFAMLDVSDYNFYNRGASSLQATINLESGESITFDITPPVPAPGALALLGAGGLCMVRRRR